ncbi:MAG: hypothetical protein QGI45_04165 [Myxococcota bacterium]|nr:hypothetical protein [Myxococcota bacterium]
MFSSKASQVRISLGVTFFSAQVLLCETAFFHILEYIHDFIEATMVVGLAVLGIGMGAFAASKWKKSVTELFRFCSVGSVCFISLGFILVLSFPGPLGSSLALPGVFFWPALYVSRIFSLHDVKKTYLFDMLGVALGVLVAVGLFKVFKSEEIIYISILAAALVTSLSFFLSRHFIWGTGWLVLVLCGCGVFAWHLQNDSLNIFYLIDAQSESIQKRKIFKRHQGERTQTYDSLTGRIDILPGKKRFGVGYNGFRNDHFTRARVRDYKKQKNRWRVQDRRFLYGVVPEPRVFVIGAAAQGILKSLRRVTPKEKIHSTEINPGILKVMREDFREESGFVYSGLDVREGNALSMLQEDGSQYDMITLMNAHSGRTISSLGAPDFLHTVESYELYFEHLTRDGYLMLEERPINRSGELALYRLIHTLYETLEKRGVKDPAQHFLIWEWQGRKRSKKIRRNRDDYYVSLLITKNPIVGDLRKRIDGWIDNVGRKRMENGRLNFNYLKGVWEVPEYKTLFEMLEKKNFDPLKEENFNSAIATNDNPFVSLGTRDNTKMNTLMLVSGLLIFLLWLFFSGSSAAAGRIGWGLNLYNLCIGFFYFAVEILLLQVYQNIFISPSIVFVLVLALMLVSSALGGLYCSRLSSVTNVLLVVSVTWVGLSIPAFLLEEGVPAFIAKGSCVILTALIGFLLGGFFPRGLMVCEVRGLRDYIPIFFAINSLGAALAVPLVLVQGMTFGYRSVLLTAVLVLFVGIIFFEFLIHGRGPDFVAQRSKNS